MNPIIGLTAHAMKKDKEDCLRSGMDSYLSKPFKAEHLFAVIDKLTSGSKISSCEEKQSIGVSEDKDNETPYEENLSIVVLADKDNETLSINQKQALDTFGGNKELLKKNLSRFCASYPQTVDMLKKALEESNAEQVKRVAHSLKGSAGLIGANRVYELAGRLEESGGKDELKKAAVMLGSLQEELEKMNQAASLILSDL